MRRDYLLNPNELLHAFLPLEILYYREGPSEKEGESRPVASLVAVTEKIGNVINGVKSALGSSL